MCEEFKNVSNIHLRYPQVTQRQRGGRCQLPPCGCTGRPKGGLDGVRPPSPRTFHPVRPRTSPRNIRSEQKPGACCAHPEPLPCCLCRRFAALRPPSYDSWGCHRPAGGCQSPSPQYASAARIEGWARLYLFSVLVQGEFPQAPLLKARDMTSKPRN